MSAVSAPDPVDAFVTGLPAMLTRLGDSAAEVSSVHGGDPKFGEPSRSTVVTGAGRAAAAQIVDEACRVGMRVIHNERDEARLYSSDVELVIVAPIQVLSMCRVAAVATLQAAGVTGEALQVEVGRALNEWVAGGGVGDHETPPYPQDPALFEILSVLLADRLREFRGWEPSETPSSFLVRPALVAASYSPGLLATARALAAPTGRGVAVPSRPVTERPGSRGR